MDRSSPTKLARKGLRGGLLMALTHAPRRWLMFDLGVDVGTFARTRAASGFVGLTVVPAVLWR